MKTEIAIAILIPLGIIILIICCLAWYADDIHADLTGVQYHRIPTDSSVTEETYDVNQ
jgi:hypothetical protein